MNKYQVALDFIKRWYVKSDHYDQEDIRLLQELIDKNIELEQAIKILKDFFIIHQKNSDYLITATGFDKLSQMDYELLKQVFKSIGGSDE